MTVQLAPALVAPTTSSAPPPGKPAVRVLASGLWGGMGSAVGPDGALYVTEWEVGRIRRIEPRTGRVTKFARRLPARHPEIPYSGPIDAAFLGDTAYALVTLVGPDLGDDAVVGLYRVDGPRRFTVVADLGAWSMAHPPAPAYEVPTGAQYALESYRGRLLVTDSHHNRVLWVSRGGAIEEVATFGNTAPTGLATRGGTVYVAQAGPIPHRPEDGRVVAFGPRMAPREVAAGAALLVDVVFGRGDTLYALAQGEWGGGSPGDPVLPDAGSLLRVRADGTFAAVLDRSTDLAGSHRGPGPAYVVTHDGEVLRIDVVRGSPTVPRYRMPRGSPNDLPMHRPGRPRALPRGIAS